VFDEAHKYIESPDLVAGLVEVVREMRHKGTSIMVASQDPPSVPVALIELSSQIILHKFNSPAWLKHIQKANAALGGLSAEKMAELRAGEAYVWSSRATDEAFTHSGEVLKWRNGFGLLIPRRYDRPSSGSTEFPLTVPRLTYKSPNLACGP
jgi:hypothetical protein